MSWKSFLTLQTFLSPCSPAICNTNRVSAERCALFGQVRARSEAQRISVVKWQKIWLYAAILGPDRPPWRFWETFVSGTIGMYTYTYVRLSSDLLSWVVPSSLLNVYGPVTMGVERGDGRTSPPSWETSGGLLLRGEDISVSLSWHVLQFCIFQHFQNKVAEIRGETKF